MRIAIFDDDFENSTKLKELLYLYSNFQKTDFVVDIFPSFEKMPNIRNYTLIFLSLDGGNKRHIAKRFYEMEITKKTIIIGSDYKLAADALMLNAFGFIKKPYNKNTLFNILRDFFKRTVTIMPIIINNGAENFCLNIADILYLEANNKHSIIHLSDQTVYCNKTMARVSAALPQNYFSKINRAFIVNLNHISSFSSKNIVLSNNEALPPSRHFYKSFKDDYLRVKSPKIP